MIHNGRTDITGLYLYIFIKTTDYYKLVPARSRWMNFIVTLEVKTSVCVRIPVFYLFILFRFSYFICYCGYFCIAPGFSVYFLSLLTIITVLIDYYYIQCVHFCFCNVVLLHLFYYIFLQVFIGKPLCS